MLNYVYTCKDKEFVLKDSDETEVKHNMFFVKCDKCCNVPVLHTLERKDS